VEVDICIYGHITAIEVEWGYLERDEVEEVIRETKRKLGGREGDYYVAARKGHPDPRVIAVEKIFREPPLATNGGTTSPLADARARKHCG
jgi:hypothetical protein